MDEVETNGSIRDAVTVSERRKAVVNGIPSYLLVPRGFKDSVQKMAEDASVPFSGII